MTPKEALKVVDKVHDYPCPYGIGGTAWMYIRNCIEKQIPKKPTQHKVEGCKIKIGNGWWGKGTTVHKCPCCNEFISRTYDYCYKCGQALDWGDNK